MSRGHGEERSSTDVSHHLRKTSPDDNSNSNVTHLLLKLFIVFTNIVARHLLELWEEARAADKVPKHLQRRVVGIYRRNSSEDK